MLFKFSDLRFLNKDIRGIIHIGAHKLEELPEYLNHNLMKIEKDTFYSTDKYSLTYEELKD